MAVGDLTSLATVKGLLRIDPGETSDDPLLAGMITARSAAFLGLVGRPLLAADYVYKDHWGGSPRIALPNYPVASVASVKLDDTVIDAETEINGPGWALVDAAAGLLDLIGYVPTLGGGYLPLVGAGLPGTWPLIRGATLLTISYRAGYSAIPADVDAAIGEWTATDFRRLGHLGVASRSQGGETTTFATGAPVAVEAIAAGYRRHG